MTIMQPTIMQRREFFVSAPALVGSGLAMTYACNSRAAEPKPSTIGYCLNTSTIRGQGLKLVEELEIASEVGYDGVELWMRELVQYQQSGGSLKDLRKRIGDLGLVIPSAIGFAEWIVDDDAKRAKGLEQARRYGHAY